MRRTALAAQFLAQASLGYRLIDADMHVYEPDDCFTRYIEPEFADRAVRVEAGPDGLGRVYIGTRRLRYISVSPSHISSPPGAFRDYLDGRQGRPPVTTNPLRPLDHPEYVEDRAARLQQLDEQGVEAAILLPTLGVTFEHELRDDPPAAMANFRAYNRWLADAWGFGADGRIFGVPAVSLLDVDLAIRELDRLLDSGARLVYLRAGPVYGLSPADPRFEGFWARAAEAGLLVVLHIGNAGYQDLYAPQWSEAPGVASHRLSPFQHLLCQVDRPVYDTLAAFVLQNLFGRFPRLRVLSLENGSSWVAMLLQRMDKAFRAAGSVPTIGGLLEELPAEVFRRHVYVSPFFEDDVSGLVREIGAERVLLGSDYPHPEGVAEPIDFLARLDGLDDRDVRRIARDNAAELLGISDS
jgi:predicted TIM-barrel fold metal-dependent hydrolase